VAPADPAGQIHQLLGYLGEDVVCSSAGPIGHPMGIAAGATATASPSKR